MPTLVLLRHAKAVRDHEAPSDQARGLTARGREDAAAAGRELAHLALGPCLALVSPALRTQMTWQEVAPALPSASAQTLEPLYLAPEEHIWRHACAAMAQADQPIIIVAHNPGLSDLAARLVALAHDQSRAARALADHMPTAAFAAFSVEPGPLVAAAPRLLAAWRPKD